MQKLNKQIQDLKNLVARSYNYSSFVRSLFTSTRIIAILLGMSLFLLVEAYACSDGGPTAGPCDDNISASGGDSYCATHHHCSIGTHPQCQGGTKDTWDEATKTCVAVCMNCQCPNDTPGGVTTDPFEDQGAGW